MVMNFFEGMLHLLNTTVATEALWLVAPLAISTLLMVVYFGIYRKEQAGWNTHLSNSFVLIFVSIALLRYITLIDNGGAYNFIDYWAKTVLTVAMLSMGLIFVRFNFVHILPERFANYINSPLTVNFMAYVVILLVYSDRAMSWLLLFGAILIVVILAILLILLKIPLGKIMKILDRERRLERLRNTREAKYQVDEMRRTLKQREKELKNLETKELEGQKQEAIKLKKVLRK